MKKNFVFKSIVVCFVLSIAIQAFAQDDYSQYLTSFTETAPPTGEVRFPAEFEPMQAVIVAHYETGRTLPVRLIKEMAEDCKVITLVNTSKYFTTDQVKSIYESGGVNIDNCEFIEVPIQGRWTRDYAPWWIFEDTKPAIVDNIYDRVFPGTGEDNPEQVEDDAISAKFAELYNVPLYGMKVVHTGGNMMQDGRGIGVSDSIVITESEKYIGVDAESVHQKMKDYLGIDTYHVTVDPQGDYIAHVDCWAKFLAPDKIIIAKIAQDQERYKYYEEVAEYFENTNCCWGYPYKVYRVEVPTQKGSFTNFASPYTNSLILNNKVFVPLDADTEDYYNNAAISIYQKAMPGYEIIGIEYSYDDEWGEGEWDGWLNTDALHCRTRGVMDFNMLFVDHRNVIFGERSLKDEYNIAAKFIAYSGDEITSTELHYCINDGEYQTVSMTATGNANEYAANITGCSVGDVVKYYVTGADASGRTCVQPTFGKSEPHSFTVVEGTGKDDDTDTDTDDDTDISNLNTFTGIGEWGWATNWSKFTVPADNEDVAIEGDVTIPDGTTVTAGKIYINGGSLTIKDGGQLIHSQEGLVATVEKEITGYGTATNDGWHTISSPMAGNLDIDSVANMTSNSYDLYYYDEPTYYWINHKQNNSYTSLEAGRGYLYANSNDVTLQFTGELNANTSTQYNLTTDGAKLNGFHLVGNPYIHNISMAQLITTAETTRNTATRETMTVEFVMGDTGGDQWNGGNSNYHYITIHYSNGSSTDITFKYNGIDDEASRTETVSIDSSEEFYVTFTGYKWTSECSLQILINGEEVFNEDGTFFGQYSDSDGDTTGNTSEAIYTYTPSGSDSGSEGDDILAEGYYTLSNTGAWGAKLNDETVIKPCQSILIKTSEAGTLTINKNATRQRSTGSNQRSIAISVGNENYADETFVVFGKGIGLDKIRHRNENIPVVYVNDNGNEYAIATMNNDVKEINVNFEAATMGEYTFSAKTQNCKLNSLTLLDKMTGAKTDILKEKYTFMATTTDNPDRFVISINDDTDNDFMYINNNEIIINNIEGNALVNIYDVMGRNIAEYKVSGSANINIENLNKGVYIIKMTDNNGVRKQKLTVSH